MSVDELHLKYLEASFEGFRRTAQSLIATSGGSIVALLGLFRVLLPVDAGVSEIAFRMRWPVVSFIATIFVAMLALLSSYLSVHYAAWGHPRREKRFRLVGVALLSAGTVLFVIGAISTAMLVMNED